MVLIISEEIDQPTSKVIEWIESFNIKWIRINFIDFFRINKSTISLNSITETEFIFNDRKIKLESIKGVWFRRAPKFQIFDEFILNKSKINSQLLPIANSIWDFIASEDLELFNYLLTKLSSHKNVIGNPFVNNLNKLEQLEKAIEVGIKIPNTIVSTDVYQLKRFLENNDCIVKPIRNIVTLNFNNNKYTSFTRQINFDDIKSQEVLFPSIIQERIKKQFEIRVFFLKGKVYSMLIYDYENSTDYRKNQYTSSIHVSKIELENSLRDKIVELASYFKLNCCSLDFIFGIDSEYYFLEINPVGQFGFLSTPCNYNLEKIIAKELCQIM